MKKPDLPSTLVATLVLVLGVAAEAQQPTPASRAFTPITAALETVTFTKPDGTSAVDEITANLRITRTNSRGVFNAGTDAIQWAVGTCAAPTSGFMDFNTLLQNFFRPVNVLLPGSNTCLHDVTTGVSYDIHWKSWSCCGAGGFSYTRVGPGPGVSCPTDSLQVALDAASPGQTIAVSGTCSENILVRNEKQRISIDGSGAGAGTRATINGSPGSPTFNVRGKGILIQNFTITGGSDGVAVNRGSNAVIDNNIIQNTGGNGVIVDELAVAAITNNTIQNNPGAGIFVSEASTARIGFNSDTETAPSPNTIQNNAIGVLVSNGSSARIIGNDVSNNSGDGIQVLRDSQADIANNTISNNAGDGITVAKNSAVHVGEDTGTGIFQSPNSGTGNAVVGVKCVEGGITDGRQGTLTATGGATSFDSSCVSGLLP